VLFLLGGMGVWNISLQQQLAASHQQLLASQQQLAASQQKITALTPTFYSIRGTSSAPNVTGQLIYYPQQHITVLILHGLPQLEGLHVYQAWLIEGQQPTSIGLLNIKNGVASVDFPGNVKGFDAAAVSLEPGPSESMPAPKGSVVAMGTLNTSASAT
jgi:anti-sigma-K factor RskA